MYGRFLGDGFSRRLFALERSYGTLEDAYYALKFLVGNPLLAYPPC